MTPELELRLYRLLRGLAAHADLVGDADKIIRYTLRLTAELFGGVHTCLACLPTGQAECQIAYQFPRLPSAARRAALWRPAQLAAFLRGEKIPATTPRDVLLARVRRRGRVWAAIGIQSPWGPGHSATDGWGEGDGLTALSRIAAGLSIALEAIERQRITEVRQRIDRKIMEQLRPRDLFYQILHALRTLIDYDHSSALLLANPGRCEAELVAEQIAWHKGKSRRIGRKLPLPAELCERLRTGGVVAFDRAGEHWTQTAGEPLPGLAELLDYNRTADDPAGLEREAGVLAAPLATRDGLIGILKVAARGPGVLGEYEGDILEQFALHASVAIQYLQRTESLQTNLLEAEKKHAVANLARGVSHDVNNALGSVLPLVQQMLIDVRAGAAAPQELVEDLTSIERSIQICRRIFGGMLGFARGAGRRVGQGNVRRAIEGTLAILEDGMLRRGITVELDLQDGLPPIRGGQGDLEQLFLNLSTNARDAMPSGGKLSISARPAGEHVEVLIRDTGVGIPPELQPRIHEPFFTTKSDGFGLGLSICRSIIWEMRGKLDLQSAPPGGTAARVLLPVADAPSAGAAP